MIFFIEKLTLSINYKNYTGPAKNFKFTMNQQIQQVSKKNTCLGVEHQGGRVFFAFRRGNFATPCADDTPRYYPQEAPSTLLVRQPQAIMAMIVPRDLNFEFMNE